jgi:serine/threonine protein kinase
MTSDFSASGPLEPQNQREARLFLLLMDSYTFVKRLGRGAFATVYQVINKSLDRTEALKVLSDELTADSDFLARFKVEAKICAAFSHPNIVTIFKSDTVENLHYFTMTFVDGPALSKFLKPENALPVSRVCAIFATVADAIDYSHQHGVIHRDLKASNIMLDRTGRPYVTDFGIAKTDKALNKTKTGMFIGSPYYVSPEQVDGSPVDHRADIYSLGVCLYALLTHQYPFEGDTAISVMAKRLTHDPIAPDLRKPDLHIDLIRIIKKTLQRHPADRYGSAAQLAAEVRHHGDIPASTATRPGYPTDPEPILSATPAAGPGKRRPWALLGALLLVLLLATGVWRFAPLLSAPNKIDARLAALLDDAEQTAQEVSPTSDALMTAQNHIIGVLRQDPDNQRARQLHALIDEKLNTLRAGQVSSLRQALLDAARACAPSAADPQFQTCLQQADAALVAVENAPAEVQLALAPHLSEVRDLKADRLSKLKAQQEQQDIRQQALQDELNRWFAKAQSAFQKGDISATIQSVDRFLERLAELPPDQAATHAESQAQMIALKSKALQKNERQAFDQTLQKLSSKVHSDFQNRDYDQCIEGAIAIKSRIESLPVNLQASYASQKESVLTLMYKAERAKQNRESQLYTLERIRRKIDEGALGSALSLLENTLSQPGIDDDIEHSLHAEKKRIQALWQKKPSNIDSQNITVRPVE